MTSATALFWCGKAASFGVFLGCLETLSRPAELNDNSLSSWRVQQLRLRLFSTPLEPIFSALFAYPNVVIFQGLRTLCALALLALPMDRPEAVGFLAAGLVLTHILLCLRSQFGWDGADQMMAIVLSAVACANFLPTPFMRNVALAFITAQALLAYLSAGLWKAVSPVWRKEPALVSVLATRSYGAPALASILFRAPTLGIALGWMVFCWEIAFPAVLFVPSTWMWYILASGAAFHLANAAVMGLNTFFWAFLATYPAIAYCAPLVRDYLTRHV